MIDSQFGNSRLADGRQNAAPTVLDLNPPKFWAESG
jgi:hypothetical protein